MFEKFRMNFISDGSHENLPEIAEPIDDSWVKYEGLIELFSQFGGLSFNSGMYRILEIDEVEKWSSILLGAYNDFTGEIIPFGYDWLGRFFCVWKDEQSCGKPEIVLFCPFSNEVLEIPFNVIAFHEKLLIENEYAEVLLELKLNELYTHQHQTDKLSRGQCMGLQVPMFLNGKLAIENLKLMNLGVYWDISAQMLKNMPR
jgi:hypothetical protein